MGRVWGRKKDIRTLATPRPPRSSPPPPPLLPSTHPPLPPPKKKLNKIKYLYFRGIKLTLCAAFCCLGVCLVYFFFPGSFSPGMLLPPPSLFFFFFCQLEDLGETGGGGRRGRGVWGGSGSFPRPLFVRGTRHRRTSRTRH